MKLYLSGLVFFVYEQCLCVFHTIHSTYISGDCLRGTDTVFQKGRKRKRFVSTVWLYGPGTAVLPPSFLPLSLAPYSLYYQQIFPEGPLSQVLGIGRTRWQVPATMALRF